jgi:antitoxin component HigA of HigAB toxin-antitoxin module
VLSILIEKYLDEHHPTEAPGRIEAIELRMENGYEKEGFGRINQK